MCQSNTEDYETNSSWFASALASALDSDQPDEDEEEEEEAEDN